MNGEDNDNDETHEDPEKLGKIQNGITFSWRKESERLIQQLEAVEMEDDPAADMVASRS